MSEESSSDSGDTVDGFLRRIAHAPAHSLGLVAAFTSNVLVPPSSPPEGEGGTQHLPVVPRENYQVLAEYGRGGMGRVLVARDLRLGRRVAIKEQLSNNPRALDRFVREVLITAHLQHPSIVPVHEAGRWQTGEAFYAMKLVSGRPLSTVIDETALLVDRVGLLPKVIAVAEAIAYAHRQRIIHRDLKPDNILVGDFGETVVIDWGLAKHLDDTADSFEPWLPDVELPAESVTVDGAVIGTPGFMAPEQASGRSVDERSDVYALGSILYTLIAGRPPYGGPDAAAVVKNTLAGPPVPLRARQPDAPADLCTIVDKAMAREPAERYASARELATDLQRFVTGQLVSVHRYTRAQRLTRFVRRHALPVGVGGVAMVLLLGTALVSFASVVHQRNIAMRERSVAMAQRAAAEEARAAERENLDRLILSQARTVVDRDPTMALAWLKRLRPEARDWAQVRVIAARAQARYVAFAVLGGRAAAFSPDGSVVAVAGDGFVRLHPNARDGAVTTLEGSVGLPSAIAISADGARLAVGGRAGARLYDLPSRRALPLDGGGAPVDVLAASPDGSLFAFGGEGGARLYDRQGRRVPAPPVRGAVTQLAWAGTRLVARDSDGVLVWDGATARRAPTHGDGPLVLSGDGKRLAFGDQDGVKWADPGTLRAHAVSDEAVATLALSPDGSTIALCARDGALSTVELASGKQRSYSHVGEECHEVAFAASGGFLASTRGPSVRVWSLADGALRKLRGHELDVEHVVFSRDGRWLASSALDDTVRVWRLDGETLRTLPLELPAGSRAALSPDGTGAAFAGVGDCLDWYDLTAGRLLSHVDQSARDLAWGGELLASAADTIALRPAAPPATPPPTTPPLPTTPAPTPPLPAPTTTIARRATRLALSSDGRWLASEDADGALSLEALPPSSAAPLRLPALPGPVALAVANDGRLAAVARGARVLQLFQGASRRELAIEEPAVALTFVDRDFIALMNPSGALELLHVPTGERWPLSAPRARPLALAAHAASLSALVAEGPSVHVRLFPPLPPDDATALRAWLEEATLARFDAENRLR